MVAQRRFDAVQTPYALVHHQTKFTVRHVCTALQNQKAVTAYL